MRVSPDPLLAAALATIEGMRDAARPLPLPSPDGLPKLAAEIVACRACPRLVAWREELAANPPARFRGQRYWARPVPGWGDPAARIVLVGLAPAAHGGNRTGRVFTGDRSGDFLFAALHRAGLANQATSTAIDDGLELQDAYITPLPFGARRPPTGRRRPSVIDARRSCSASSASSGTPGSMVALGAFGWDAALRAIDATDGPLARPWPTFGHAVEAGVGRYALVGTFHPSQQNTFTGRLTAGMLDAVLRRARELAGA